MRARVCVCVCRAYLTIPAIKDKVVNMPFPNRCVVDVLKYGQVELLKLREADRGLPHE